MTTGAVAVLTTVTSAQLTVILTGPEVLLPGLVSPSELTLAVLLIAGQFVVEVVAVRVMVFVVLGAMVPNTQVRVVPPVTGELGEQLPASAPPTVQLGPAGNTSVRTTFVELVDAPEVTTTL